MILALAAAASLGACGRKGPLEPPPAAQLTGPAEAKGANAQGSPAPGRIFGGATAEEKAKEPPPAMDEFGRPLAQSGGKKPFFLDFLLK